MSKKSNQELKATEEIIQFFEKSQAAISCRDKCINSLFKSKRAIEYGYLARKYEQLAWKLSFKLYPQLEKEEGWRYYHKYQIFKRDTQPPTE